MKKLLLILIFITAIPAFAGKYYFAGIHYFTDGIIPAGAEVSIGYVDIETDSSWIDLYLIPIRLEAPVADNVSLFGEIQYRNYDPLGSTYSLGTGAMINVIKDGVTLPFNVSLRGAFLYSFEKKDEIWTAIPSIFTYEGRAIVSKQFGHAVNWTPYANLVYSHNTQTSVYNASGKKYTSRESYLDFVLGLKLRFDQFAIFGEGIFGDQDAIGIGGSFTF